MVNLGCYECVDQSFTMTERDIFSGLRNVAQVVESRLAYAVYLLVIVIIISVIILVINQSDFRILLYLLLLLLLFLSLLVVIVVKYARAHCGKGTWYAAVDIARY